MRRRPLLLTAVLGAALLLPASGASAATRFYVQGAGFGHGIGMSQYGAYGYARHGAGYRFMLRHYYRGTSLGQVARTRTVRVLLEANEGAVSFSGATRAGSRRMAPGVTYTVRRFGLSGMRLYAGRHRLASYGTLVRVTGPGPLRLSGTAINGVRSGLYRGALEVRPATFGGLNAINAAGLDDYVAGVVPGEMPASWPMEALKAQAVAARSYGITTDAGGNGFDQYPDTRSQVYQGVNGEDPRGNAAVRATAGQVVTYHGEPVTTFFFSTSGGRTENVEDSFIGSDPKPWLRSVDDPYDYYSPKHRWSFRFTMGQASAKLGGLVRGSFRGIRVLRRGHSPRVVSAQVIGTRGRSSVSGPTLRSRLGLYDTWAYFYVVRSGNAPRRLPELRHGGGAPSTPAAGGGSGGGIAPRVAAVAMAVSRAHQALVGSVSPGRTGALVRVQRLQHGRWHTVGTARLRRGGAYLVTPTTAGTYRIVYRGMAGAAVRLR